MSKYCPNMFQFQNTQYREYCVSFKYIWQNRRQSNDQFTSASMEREHWPSKCRQQPRPAKAEEAHGKSMTACYTHALWLALIRHRHRPPALHTQAYSGLPASPTSAQGQSGEVRGGEATQARYYNCTLSVLKLLATTVTQSTRLLPPHRLPVLYNLM